MSITRRLILLMTCLVAGLWLATALISRSVIVHEIEEIYHDNLSNTAIRFMPLVLHALSERADDDHPDDDHENDYENDDTQLDEDLRFFAADQNGFLAYQVHNREGRLIIQSYDANTIEFPPDIRSGYTMSPKVMTFSVVDKVTGLSLTIAESAKHRAEAIREATTALFAPLLLLLPLLVLGAYLLIRLTLKPIDNLRSQIATRGGSNFDPIIADFQPVEIRPIVQSVDRLLERLKQALDAERTFADSTVHELRTPLAGALAQIQTLRAHTQEPAPLQLINNAEESIQRVIHLNEKILQMARAKTEIGLNAARTDMGPIVDAVLGEYSFKPDSHCAIEVTDNLHQPLMVAMDPDSFAIALRNLIENAIKHSGVKDPISIKINPDWTLHVINNGAVVPADTLNTLTSRFVRGASSMDGSGLGLSIVNQIMKNAGGRLDIYSPAIGEVGGFEAVLKLP